MKTMGMQPSADTVEVNLSFCVCAKRISSIICQKMIKIADKDGSGVVEFQEFMEMICDQVEVRN